MQLQAITEQHLPHPQRWLPLLRCLQPPGQLPPTGGCIHGHTIQQHHPIQTLMAIGLTQPHRRSTGVGMTGGADQSAAARCRASNQ